MGDESCSALGKPSIDRNKRGLEKNYDAREALVEAENPHLPSLELSP